LIENVGGIILKKFGLAILMVIVFAVLSFLGYSLFVKIEFENYLSEKHPTKTFEVDFPNYSLIHFGTIVFGDYFHTSAYCSTDDTKFFMSRSKGAIKENYLERKNKKILVDTISSYITRSDYGKYVHNINVGEKKQVNLSVEEIQDINNSIEVIYIAYKDNIKDNKDLTDVSYNIINTLKFNKLNFNEIRFIWETKSSVYELNLKGEDINKTSMEFLDMIVKRK